jgi:glycosyltransferase involved in cell wall biosynthesis
MSRAVAAAIPRTSPLQETAKRVRVGLFAGSPVPFKVPLYRRIARAEGIDLTVMYSSTMGIRPATAGYSTGVVWDRDLLGGYPSTFLRGAERNAPMATRFTDLVDFDIVPWVTKEAFDVLWLEGYSSITHLLALAAQRTKRLGLVLRDEATLLDPRSLAKMIAKEVAMRGLFSQLDAAVYISRENRRWLEHYGLPSERMFSSPYCPDSDFFGAEAQRLAPERDGLRAGFGFAEDVGPIVMSVSRLAASKQPEMLIEAFRRVRAGGRCGLLLVGSGPLEHGLRELVESQQIPDVRFAGFLNQTEVTNAYAASDVFALLSAHGETYGVAVAEAMHFGLALLLSDRVGSAADLLGDGSNGFLVHHDDVDLATRRLEQLVADGEMRERMGRASVSRIAERNIDVAAAGALAAISCAAARAHRRAKP